VIWSTILAARITRPSGWGVAPCTGAAKLLLYDGSRGDPELVNEELEARGEWG